MPEFSKYEENGMFYLSEKSGGAYDITSDDFGTGSGYTINRFFTAEGREYFIQAENARAAHRRCAHDLACIQSSLHKIVKKRGVRKAIMELLRATERTNVA